MTQGDRILDRRFSVLQASCFCIVAVQTGFFSVLLSAMGCTDAQIGLIATVSAGTALITQPLMGVLCDRLGWYRLLYLAAAVLGPVSIWMLMHAGSFAGILIWSCIFGGITMRAQFLGEGWIAALNAQGRSLDYGRSRSAGSLSFALASVVIGLIIERAGLGCTVLLLLIFGVCMSAAVLGLTEPSLRAGDGPKESFWAKALKLASEREYLALSVCSFLACIPFNASLTYYPIFLTEVGGSAALVGLSGFVMAVVEVPVYALLFGAGKTLWRAQAAGAGFGGIWAEKSSAQPRERAGRCIALPAGTGIWVRAGGPRCAEHDRKAGRPAAERYRADSLSGSQRQPERDCGKPAVQRSGQRHAHAPIVWHHQPVRLWRGGAVSCLDSRTACRCSREKAVKFFLFSPFLRNS